MGKPVTNFGWRMNAGMDGFEQTHGRFMVEVFWSDTHQQWSYVIWDKNDHKVEQHPVGLSLAQTKVHAHKRVSLKEKEALGVKPRGLVGAQVR